MTGGGPWTPVLIIIGVIVLLGLIDNTTRGGRP